MNIIRFKYSQTYFENKFGCLYIPNSPKGLNKFLYGKGLNYLCFIDFVIFSASFLKEFPDGIFDETFINAYEDHDVSLSFYLEKHNYTFIDYQIADYIGSSLGTGVVRELRNTASLSFLNYKYEKSISKVV